MTLTLRDVEPWSVAWQRALYGPGGFYARGEAPADHFRTSVHASPLYAAAIGELLRRVDEALGHPDPLDLVDVGAGRGELLAGVVGAAAGGGGSGGAAGGFGGGADGFGGSGGAGGLAGAGGFGGGADGFGADGFGGRLRRWAVEARPLKLTGVTVVRSVADLPRLTGLLIANEWLDDVPVDVVELTAAGPRLVLVDRTGAETLGEPPDPDAAAWLDRWWPLTDPARKPPAGLAGGPHGLGDRAEPGHRAEVGDRAEVGAARDAAWAAAVGRLGRGVAVAVDYAHERDRRPAGGTLTGYRGGSQVRPVPDGSCDLTAHVALDSVAAAGQAAGATETRLDSQRVALSALGVTGRRPPIELARTDPPAYLAALARAGEAAELTAPAGLGGFGWLVQGVGVRPPFPPVATRARVRRAPAPPPAPAPRPGSDPRSADWMTVPTPDPPPAPAPPTSPGPTPRPTPLRPSAAPGSRPEPHPSGSSPGGSTTGVTVSR